MRETSFSGGALALALTLTHGESRAKHVFTQVARYFVAVPVLFFCVELFLHGNFVPALPLNRVTPDWLWGHSLWTYLSAAVYAVAGPMLLLGKRSRAAATAIGLTVLAIELFVYVPIGVVDRASLSKGLNFVADTLMFCGAVLMLAGAMPKSEERASSIRVERLDEHRSRVTV